MTNTPLHSSKGNLLIVDDTPANLRLLVGILKERGYQVRPAPNGELALSAAQGIPPDLILLDIMMPKMDGYEVCQRLKADKRTSEIPVIFISAINEVLDKVKAFAVGGVDYITKPFQVEEVLARVETHLALRHLQKNLQAKNEYLAKTLQQLKATQDQLIESEKMAALGQLIAGIAHEVNTPLGAIRSSVENMISFLSNNLEDLPEFFRQLSPEMERDFLKLIHTSIHQKANLSSREKRQKKKHLISQLTEKDIENAELVADYLVDMNIYEEIENFWLFLQTSESLDILNVAYQLTSLLKSAENIKTATDRAAKLVFSLKSYAHYDKTGKKLTADVIEGIETVLTLYQNHFKQGVEVIRKFKKLPRVECYPDELNQVWTNLIHNALQAMNYRGTLNIEAKQQDEYISVSITDSGQGIPLEIQPKIFEPFFTTKLPGEGSGLGLDIVKKIIDKHQGKIKVESLPGQTTFTMLIPLNNS
ncbi:MAG: response regulator [Coleofasciculaceae cyanobacterium]